MNRAWAGLLMVAVGLVVVRGALADSVHLHDGRVIRGKVTSDAEAPVVEVQTPYGPVKIRASEVKQIERHDEPLAQPPASQPQISAEPEAPAPTATVTAGGSSGTTADQIARDKYAEARRNADKAATGADGASAWEQFLKDCPSGPQADLARKELAVWQDRATRNLVRFGPNWLAKEQVQDRQAKADELVAKADGTQNLDEAVRLLDQAAQHHPYRADIPMKKALLYHRAKKPREFGTALGEVVRIEPDNVAARNNLGVLAALQQQWGMAVMNLTRAAASDRSVILDNLDQVLWMAVQAGAPDKVLQDAERQLSQLMVHLRAAGKHVKETRWGNRWVTEEQRQKYLAENSELDRNLAANRNRIEQLRVRYRKCQDTREEYDRLRKSIETDRVTGWWVSDYSRVLRLQEDARRAEEEMKEIEAEVKKVREESAALESKRNVPGHAGRLVLLGADGSSQLESIDVKPPEKPDAGKDAKGP